MSIAACTRCHESGGVISVPHVPILWLGQQPNKRCTTVEMSPCVPTQPCTWLRSGPTNWEAGPRKGAMSGTSSIGLLLKEMSTLPARCEE